MKRKIVLTLSEQTYSELMSHLLPSECKEEHAAFVFSKCVNVGKKAFFEFVEWKALTPSDFVHHSAYYIELRDQTRASLIKRAHDLKASLVEFHSHPFSKNAMFSHSDYLGFKEFVPHVWWRLKSMPYIAVVVTPNNFDALVWINNPSKPEKLDYIKLDNRVLIPTDRSYYEKYGDY